MALIWVSQSLMKATYKDKPSASFVPSQSGSDKSNAVSDVPMVPVWYVSYVNVFSEENAGKLLLHQGSDHAIDMEGHKPSYDLLYNLSETELQVLKGYLDNTLVNVTAITCRQQFM